MELLVGCGTNRDKKMYIKGRAQWDGLVTLDMFDAHKPDVVHDLTHRPLPFGDDAADEIHAYDVLEHLSQQGDYRSFFAEWSEWWRILKPGGLIFAISPHWSSPWAWGDPGHTRVYGIECLTYLDQTKYSQVGTTSMTDYRPIYKADFEVMHAEAQQGGPFQYVLKAHKPARGNGHHS